MDARFIGFDLNIKDKNGNTLCVGDEVKETYEDEETTDVVYGKIIYSADKKAFGILWKEENYCELFADIDLNMIGRFLEKAEEN